MMQANSDYVKEVEAMVDNNEITASEGFRLLLGALKQGEQE